MADPSLEEAVRAALGPDATPEAVNEALRQANAPAATAHTMATAVAEAEALLAIEDPETEPYKSRYAAREKLEAAQKALLAGMLSGNPGQDPLTQVAVLDHRVGVIAMDVEEYHNAEPKLGAAVQHFLPEFQTALDAVPVRSGEAEAAQEAEDVAALEAIPAPALTDRIRAHPWTVIDALNHLGVLWTGREAPGRSRAYLRCAEAIYQQLCREEGVEVEPRVDRLYTHTAFYLAQVYGLLGDSDMSSTYCCTTLQRQLAEPGLDALGWTQNCMRLSDFYLGHADFSRAAHCLLACDEVLRRAAAGEGDVAIDIEAEGDGCFRERKADVERSWGHLFAGVLTVAKELAQGSADAEDVVPPAPPLLQPFNELGLGEPAAPVSAPEVTSFEAARDLFKVANGCLTRAKAYYVIDGFVTTHVSIVRDVSTLYKCLSAWETDEKRRLAMHARRVAVLEPLMSDLNKESYDDLLKHVSFEVGEAYTEMVDLKLGRIEAKIESTQGYVPKPAELAKAGEYAQGAIRAYTFFCSMYLDAESGEPRTLADYEAGPFLRAHFYIARMHDKLHVVTVNNTPKQVAHLADSLREYEWICSFAPQYESEFSVELRMSREMAALLPAKIARLNSAR